MFQFDWPSHKALLAIAMPMILSNITVPLLGLVDTAVVGHLDAPFYLGGVAVGSMIVTFIFWMAGFLRMATTGVTAQAYGSGDGAQQIQKLVHGIAIALGLALLILVLMWPIRYFGFALAGGSAEVQSYGQQYFSIRIFSAPAALTNLVLLGWMLGMQNAKGPMWHLIFTNIVNILLDLLFVFGFDWGVKGVAAASVVADYCGVAIGLYFVAQIAQSNGLHFDPKQLAVWRQWQALKPLLLINRDIFLRTFALMVCFAFMTFQGAKLGDNIVAANAILQNFLMLVSFGLDGIAYAVEALVGKAVGKRSRSMLVKSIQDALFWSVVFALFYCGLFWFAGEWLIALMSDLPQVRETALVYLPWMMVLPIVSMWCFLFDGIFIGLTRAKDMRNSMFISTVIGFFMVWFMLQSYGNHALWAAMTGFMAMRGLTLALKLRSLMRSEQLISGHSVHRG